MNTITVSIRDAKDNLPIYVEVDCFEAENNSSNSKYEFNALQYESNYFGFKENGDKVQLTPKQKEEAEYQASKYHL